VNTDPTPRENRSSFDPKNSAFHLLSVVLLGVVLPLAGRSIVCHFLAKSRWVSLPFHSTVETLGMTTALTAGIMVALLLSESKQRRGLSYEVWICCGLMGMGVLDGFHAVVEPGNSFVWLHSLAVVVGGLLFSLVWLPEIISSSIPTWSPVTLTTALAVLVGVFSLAFPDYLPVFQIVSQVAPDGSVLGAVNTPGANGMNVVGGVLFLLGALRVLTSQDSMDRVFAHFAVLWGSASALSPLSQDWTAEWWFWHLLRGIASLILMAIVFIERQRIVDSLSGLIRELAEGVDVLRASGNDILTTTAEFSASAAETSAAVNQTSVTVEEVRQTALVSNDKARMVSDNAQQTVQVSQNGRQSVDSTIESMSRIRHQMESVADSIVRLSEHTQTIGETVAAVNDLAEQSKLLALNAAIEAARAGEQGRGFAVVAQEIRSLAVQSTQATTQVRTMLNDIMKSTSAAVTATEEGTRAVEAGSKKATEAGQAIHTLAAKLAESAQAALQIAASSQQQLLGTDQVALAIGNIKRASDHTAAGTRQAESAARQLNDLAKRLADLVTQHGA